MTGEPIIEVDNLHVRYGQVAAVNGLSLRITRGEIFGLLGPNGAGKSSTLACIEGLRAPDEGRVCVAGYDVARNPNEVKRRLGVQLQKAALFVDLNLIELMRLYAAMYEVFPSKGQILAQLETFGLAQRAQARAEQLSGGQQQRLALAIALVNDPQIVLLDEPTTGLDPLARRGVWSRVSRLREEGRTVLLTTHSMEEAQELCTRVGIVNNGKLVVIDTPQGLVAQYAPPLPPEEAARRQPNLEDVFLALTGRNLAPGTADAWAEDEAEWAKRTSS